VGYQAGGTGSTGSNNTYFGYQAGQNVTTGCENVMMGYQAGASLVTGSRNILLGRLTDVYGPGDSGMIVIGDNISSTGATGVTCIGRSATIGAATGSLWMRHRVAAGGVTASWSGGELRENSSSLRFKTVVGEYTYADEDFDKLNPVWYTGKPGHNDPHDPDRVYAGLVAEELDLLFPEYVSYDDIPEKTIPKGINYEGMVTLAIAELQKIRAKNRELEAQLKALLE
jgi:hypothetical protein